MADRENGKRARTREALIEAASALVGEKGFERTGLEEVARRAGMSRGAIYGNFRDREALFLAVAERSWQPVAPPFRPGATLREQMRILGEAVAAEAEARRARAVGALSFQLYALTHEEMRARLRVENARLYAWAADNLLRFVDQADLPMPAERFVRVLHALTEGLILTHALTPALIAREEIVAAFEALA
ncbi:MAG TPA: TetR/AcrR family transcriptional regulator [Allosphingosinicella sp.]|jgi:AcrR family transcriptional regulator|nr:TetR/AcrR family transcriptional regulator [Allosphingosinicella sp.]